ncbi:MAG TPA: MmcQ/YjbR family DNA-binding protein [Bryobacteraceae bacterium]|jgi:predicted DNA-binding protein (MmcQ/YjbR family)
MDIEWVRKLCLSFPQSTEKVQWGNNLVFKVAGKMFAVADLEGGGDHWLSFKCEPATFAELIERPGIIPAPYLARAHWVALERENSIPRTELKTLLRTAYDLTVAKLPKKTQSALAGH